MNNKIWKIKKLTIILTSSIIVMRSIPVWAEDNTGAVQTQEATLSEPTDFSSEEQMSAQKPEQPETSESTQKSEQSETPEPMQKPEQPETPEPMQKPEQPETPEPTQKPEQTVTPAPTETPVPFNPASKGSVIISRKKMKKGIKENSDFYVEIILQNTWSDKKLKDVKLTPDTASGISLDASYMKETLDISDIEPDSVQKIKVKFHADKIDTNQSVLKLPVSVAFCVADSSEKTEVRETLLIPVDSAQDDKEFVDNTADYSSGGADAVGSSDAGDAQKKADPMMPRIIVTQYDYDKSATVGQEFTANITVQNTNDKLNAENMVVTFDTGETASIEDGSNTIYIQKLAPQKEYTASIKLKLPEDSKNAIADVNVNFKYEYMKNTERTEAESSSKISIPVQSVDRFDAGDIQTSDDVTQGEEFTVSLPYVNKGNSTVHNLEAYITTDMKTSETYKYIGNVDAGSSNTADFFVTPENTGKSKVEIELKYEDASGNAKTIKKEGCFQVSEAEEDISETEEMDGAMEDSYETTEKTSSENKRIITAVIVVGIVAIGSSVVIFRKKKHKNSEDDEEL